MPTRKSVLGVLVVGLLGLWGCGGGGKVASTGGNSSGGTTTGVTTDSTVTRSTGALEGRVLDANGNPVAGAQITVSSGTAARSRQSGGYTTTTDQNGWYRCGNLPPGHYSVMVQQNGTTTTLLEADVQPNLVTTNDQVTTTPAASGPAATTGRIVGAVRSSNGSAVSPAHVSVVEATVGADVDSRGYYKLGDLPAGDYHLKCTAAGYQEATTDLVHLEAGVIKVVIFVMKPVAASAGKIHGTVKDSAAAALANATVRAKSGAAVVYAKTDSAGAYVLAGLAPGSYELKCGLADYGLGEATVTVAAGQDVEQNFVLEKVTATLGSITGQVKSTDGKVIVGALVGTNAGGKPTSAKSNSDGKYQINDVPAGTYKVYCGADGYQPTSVENVVVVASQATTQDFTLTAVSTPVTGVIEGAVKDADGKPIAGAKVAAAVATSSRGGRPNTAGSAVTGSEGRYRIPDLAAGTYTLTCSKDGYQTATGDATVEAGKAVTRDFVLTSTQAATGTLVGRVTGSDGKPVAGARIGVGQQSGSYTKYGSTDDSGAYRLTGLPAGTYNVVAAKDGYQSSTATGVVITAGQTTNQDFVLQVVVATGTAVITGVVQTADGTPLAGATVSPRTATITPVYVNTDANGRFTVANLVAATYVVFAGKTGYEYVKVENVVVANGATVTLTITLKAATPTTGKIAGTVKTKDGAAMSGAVVYALQGATTVASTTTDSSGHYQLTTPPGTYLVGAGALAYTAPGAYNVVVTAGATTTVDFTMVKGNGGAGTIKVTVQASDGALVAGASVACVLAGTVSVYGVTDAAGQVTIEGLLAGTYKVYAGKKPTYAPATVENVVLGDGATLALTVTMQYAK